jgi:hypothetical protein
MNLQENILRIKEVMGIQNSKWESGINRKKANPLW